MASRLTDVAAPRRRSHTVRWVVLGVALAALLPLTVVFGQQLADDGSGDYISPLRGQAAPEFSLANIDGGEVSSASLAGRPYVVNFWASWCVPCRDEHPHLEAFHARTRDRGVGLVGVIYSDKVSNARAYRAELGGDWPLVADAKGRTAIDFGVTGPPETFVVDSAGTIVYNFRGPVGAGDLEEVLSQIR